jgi:glycosyltransferase involved in cell wall biosynthesis
VSSFPSGNLVEVLLATYNGERFLPEQIDSILSQTHPSVRILARDDGSKDKSVAILRRYEIKYADRFRLIEDGIATGHPKRNFERLMRASTAPYVALSDQDDVWLPWKLEHQLDAMQAAERSGAAHQPVLVFSDLQVVDDRLRTLSQSFWQRDLHPGRSTERYARLLAQNIFTGCTGLLNRSLVERAIPIPERAFMHDWWIMLVAAAFGRLVPLPAQTVLYRQHASNVVGAFTKGPSRINFRYHGVRRKLWEMSNTNAYALMERFRGELPSDKRHLVEAYIRSDSHPNRFIRVFTFLRYGFFRTSFRGNLGVLYYLWDMEYARRTLQS